MKNEKRTVLCKEAHSHRFPRYGKSEKSLLSSLSLSRSIVATTQLSGRGDEGERGEVIESGREERRAEADGVGGKRTEERERGRKFSYFLPIFPIFFSLFPSEKISSRTKMTFFRHLLLLAGENVSLFSEFVPNHGAPKLTDFWGGMGKFLFLFS